VEVSRRFRDAARGLLISLMMEAAETSETSVNFTGLYGATTQNTVVFLLAVVRTSNPTYFTHLFSLHSATTHKTVIFMREVHRGENYNIKFR
jgi:hypothetical protein